MHNYCIPCFLLRYRQALLLMLKCRKSMLNKLAANIKITSNRHSVDLYVYFMKHGCTKISLQSNINQNSITLFYL